MTDLTRQLAGVLDDIRPQFPDRLMTSTELAEALQPYLHGLLADARTDGFRQGFTAGRTLNRERRMS